MDENTRRYLAEIGRRGGTRSRRRLDPDTARRMVRVREARKAFRRFHASCFWSSPVDLEIGEEDIPWVVDRLRRSGNQEAWDVARRLCP
jgi:hypothetical protein